MTALLFLNENCKLEQFQKKNYFKFISHLQDEGNIICPECARKKMTEELEAQSDD